MWKNIAKIILISKVEKSVVFTRFKWRVVGFIDTNIDPCHVNLNGQQGGFLQLSKYRFMSSDNRGLSYTS